MKGSIQAASNDKANLETTMTEELDRLSEIYPIPLPDLLMLENQLPFFILKDLFDGVNCVDKERKLLVLSRNFLGGGLSTFEGMLDNLERINSFRTEQVLQFEVQQKNSKFETEIFHNTPWAIISFFAALILLILTVIQTFCSVMSISA
ncbi:hypothetical protein M0R45_026639 [Rubus argutus]|uniref:Uncharacterized protein n=1 Tax=Rubus argutus TaxID=59490 RepID=A0AAW1WYK9_RUBAR